MNFLVHIVRFYKAMARWISAGGQTRGSRAKRSHTASRAANRLHLYTSYYHEISLKFRILYILSILGTDPVIF